MMSVSLLMLMSCAFLVVFVAWLRFSGVLNWGLATCLNSSLLIYGLLVFFLLPLLGAPGTYIVGAGEEFLAAIKMLEVRLAEKSVPPENSLRVMVAYSFSALWLPLSSAFIAGVAIGITKSERELLIARENKIGANGWSFLVFSSIVIFLLMYWLLFSEFMSAPLEAVDERCWKTCSYLEYGLFPYFFKIALLMYGWHFFMAILLKSASWKIMKRSFDNVQ